MEVTGKIKKIDETKTYGDSFNKREMVLTTDDQYPQILKIEFIQDKCDLLNNYKENDDVKISINLTGREWTNPEGKVIVFNSIQGWRVEKLDDVKESQTEEYNTNEVGNDLNENEPDDLPF